MIKQSAGNAVILIAIIPVIIQAGIMVGITFYGFALALLTSMGVI